MRSKIYAIIIDASKHHINLIQKELSDGIEKEITISSLRSDSELCADNMKQVDAIITIGNIKDSYKKLSSFGEDFTGRWKHFESNVDNEILVKTIIEIFKNNLYNYPSKKTFSIITPTYNTTELEIKRLYNSLIKQTYLHWDWWILDDSSNDNVIKILEGFNDARIYIFKNISHKGSIGFNKGVLGCMCSGNYIVEVDHDDELTDNCLQILYDAFKTYPDAGFAYSNTLEFFKDGPADYGDEWGNGCGGKQQEIVNGEEYTVMVTPPVNCESLRMGWTCPNHVRCWRRDIYDKLRGFNRNLSITDDYELVLRTFINSKFIKVNKALYIQHHETLTESYRRIGEIARQLPYILDIYDKDLHNRIPNVNDGDDLIWDEENQKSLPIERRFSALKPLSYIYTP